MASTLRRQSPLGEMVARSRAAFVGVGLFSGVINLLALTGSFYMLQVYDRVLTSRSVPTLVALSVLALALYALQALLEIIRVQVMSRIGARLERDLLQPVHDLLLRLPLAGRSAQESMQPLRDMEAMRNFLSGQAPIAFLDLPWMPLYLAFIFLLHPLLGWLAVAGMLVLIAITLLTEMRMRAPSRAAMEASGRRYQIAEASRRNIEALRAMGFGQEAARRFFRASGESSQATQTATDVAGSLGALSRTFRMVLQSAMLGVGAWLVLKNQMSAGGIIACSIVAGRALAPVELAIGNWRVFATARQARHRLDDLLRVLHNEMTPIDLPLPRESVQVEGLAVAAPGQRTPIVRNARLQLRRGDAVAILGASGAGKSTLARAVVGAWPPLAGSIRLDGAPLEQYPVAKLGQIIGYLPQDVELFDGTVAENIARLAPEPDEAAVIEAAKAAQVHDLILRLSDGYQTRIGEGGANLSAGQRQRIGLARALFGNPFLVVLDEPNAHLDSEGEAALIEALKAVRARGGIAIIVAHRPSVLAAVNLVAFLADGEMKGFGPRDEVLKRLATPAGAPPAAAPTPQRPTTAEPDATVPQRGLLGQALAARGTKQGRVQ